MLFNSYLFSLFFSAVLCLYYLPVAWCFRKTLLLLSSFVFYAAWNPPFVMLLWLSTAVDWFAAKLVSPSHSQYVRYTALACSLTCNLGVLFFFKYANMAASSVNGVLHLVGFEGLLPVLNLVLPVGISFYTFQTLSYTLDVFNGKSRPSRSLLDFALYVSFFPQLVAGPIVRATDFLPQCISPARLSLRHLSWGLNLVVLGLFEKIFVADSLLAPIVDNAYSQMDSVHTLSAWLTHVAFAGQIYCDFAGYSTIAIGVAMCFGFALPDNFHWPYASIGFSDFWRRWHITLSTWLRDYLYIPLGGNRGSRLTTLRNLMLTMLIGGLWHGASWTFVAWGGLHGAALIFERLVSRSAIGCAPFWNYRLSRVGLCLLTFAVTCLTWVFFRSESISQALAIVKTMLVPDFELTLHPLTRWDAGCVVGVMGLMLALHWFFRESTLEDLNSRFSSIVVGAVNAAMICAIVMTPGSERAFIYFQF